MGERILALKQKLVETLKTRFGAFPKVGDMKEKARAKFNLPSIDYVSEGLAIIIVYFTYLSVGTIELGASDDISNVVSEFITGLLFQAILSIIALYLLTASAHILLGRDLLRPVLIWFSVFALWEVINAFTLIDELSAELSQNFGLVMACGNGEQEGLISSFSKDPQAAAGLALLTGIDVTELQQACNMLGNLKYIPFGVLAYEIVIFAGLFFANKFQPIAALETKKEETNED